MTTKKAATPKQQPSIVFMGNRYTRKELEQYLSDYMDEVTATMTPGATIYNDDPVVKEIAKRQYDYLYDGDQWKVGYYLGRKNDGSRGKPQMKYLLGKRRRPLSIKQAMHRSFVSQPKHGDNYFDLTFEAQRALCDALREAAKTKK